MKVARKPDNEKERLAALLSYKVLDTGFDKTYDDLTQLASDICGTPIALISLIDTNRQWFKAKVGIEAGETPRDWAFCAHALLQDDVLVVEDTFEDERFVDNPLVLNDPSIRFYAGAQIRTQEGYVLGTVCAIDRIPRQLTAYQLNALKVLAKQVMTHFELPIIFGQLQKHAVKLQEMNAARDKLFAILSHDLRAPLGGILGLSEVLLEDMDSQPVDVSKELVTEIHDASQQSLALLDNILRWTLLESGKVNFTPMTIPLIGVVQKVTRLLSPLALKKKVNLHVDCPEHLFVSADQDMLASILQNLLANAIKFTPAQGDIHLTATEAKRQVVIRVKDSGVGMSKEQVEKLFSPNKQTSTLGTEGETGTGLGLVLCRQFLALHKTGLEVQSEPGKGTTFKFTLAKAGL